MEEIYEKYSRTVYNYLLCLTKNPEIAKELMQETFYSAIKNISKFRNECTVSVWLCQIAKNKWNDELKKQKKMKFVEIDDNIENALVEDSFENDIVSREELIELYTKIHNLEEKTREVFYLRIKGELTFKEIGIILHRSEEWARITFYRGKIKIKEGFKNEQ